MTPHKELKLHITVQEINEFNPCYPAESKLGDDWSGTLIDILKMDNVSPEDKIWAVSLFAGDKINRLFAVHCAREALKLIEKPDPRSIAACDVAEKFVEGKATQKELDAAWDAAWAAARDAAWAAAWAAARDAAWAAALAAARDAARAAARDAARDAAWAAARDAARAAQIKQLIKMLEAK